MGKIYAPPTEVGTPPRYDHKLGWEENGKAENAWVEKVKAYARLNGSGKYAGEEVKFQVADGYAIYIVLSLKPVQLIHLPIGDGYQERFVNRLTAKDLTEEIERGQALKELFG